MTPQEAKAMEGTEFIYFFPSGDSMPAYVKKVDLERNIMSCWSFSLTTKSGSTFEPLNKDEEIESACCLLTPRKWSRIKQILKEIKATNEYHVNQIGFYGSFSGCPL